ncbi:MAG: molybdopterin-dependent oxidoreductase [Proteobacteria bacterium]|nr:molybdopterin-dependent oxidoreductase [Pseudomonadota bacterium]
MNALTKVSRRQFIGIASGGIAVLIGSGALCAVGQERRFAYPTDVNAYLLIGDDGRVTVLTGKIEMGQGVMTSLAQMAAEELDVDLAAINMVMGDTDRCPWDMGTFGSLTTRMFGPALRAAAAEARAILVNLAAVRLGVPKARLTVRSAVVSVTSEPARRVTYAELARGKRLRKVVDARAVLRSAAQFRIMGHSPQRLDGREKVTGEARYAADIRLPGMLYARILRPPAHGSTLLRLDTSAAEAMPGVIVIRKDGLVAVLHEDERAADLARSKVSAGWSRVPQQPDTESIFGHLVSGTKTLHQVAARGALSAGRSRAARIFQMEYRKGYVAHAPIEPHAALAQVTDAGATVWASTQTPFPTRDRIAKTLGLQPQHVRVITPFLGGGFGGKSADGQALEAARLAAICGRPVQVAWDRSEEFFYDRFDPAAVVKLVSGLDSGGRIVLWDYSVYGTGERGAIHLYDVPNLAIRTGIAPSYGDAAQSASLHPFEVGPWRAPGANMNVFAIESQMDLMAAAAGVDPVTFRLRHLKDARMRQVLQTAVASFGWRPAVGPSGRGIGVACSTDAGSYVASVGEVSVERSSGRVSVSRVVCAEDLGLVVNPDGARMQIEGATTMGIGYTLTEEVKFRGGEILDRSFASYHIPRFSVAPKVEAVLVSHQNLPAQGGGEPPITTVGAMVANAVFDATGARLPRLPMTAERVTEALAKASART